MFKRRPAIILHMVLFIMIFASGALAAETAFNDQSNDQVYEFKCLSEMDVAKLAASLTVAFHLEPGQLTQLGRTFYLSGDPRMVNRLKQIVMDKDVPAKHIIFEATFITVNPMELKKAGMKLTGHYDDPDAMRSDAAGNVTPKREHIIDIATNYGLSGGTPPSFTHTVIWTFSQGAQTFNLTAGYVLENGLGKIVSKPVVRVKDGDSASFKSVVNIPYATTSDRGTKIEFKEAGISLDVVNAYVIPSPTPNLKEGDAGYVPENIWADIVVKDGNPGSVRDTNLVSTFETTLTSRGYFRNGETFIAGSLVKENGTSTNSSVPVMHKLPLIGRLFRSKSIEYSKLETIILIRPTIEEPGTQKALAARFTTAQDLLSLSLGGREHDSIHIHPMSDAPWKAVPEIYDSWRCPAETYWALLSTYTRSEIDDLGKLFIPVRARIGFISGQSLAQLEMLIMTDKGIEESMDGSLDAFASKTGKRKPTYHEFLIAAAHTGTINEWGYHVYMKRLGIKDGCEQPSRAGAEPGMK